MSLQLPGNCEELFFFYCNSLICSEIYHINVRHLKWPFLSVKTKAVMYVQILILGLCSTANPPQ